MLTGEQLNDAAGIAGLIDSSSMQHLPDGVSFNDFLRGDGSLGARMEQRGLDAVPSPARLGPGTGLYFSQEHSRIAKAYRGVVNVVGVSIPLYNERGNGDDDDCDGVDACVTRRTIRKVSKAIIDYYKQHYGKYSSSKLAMLDLVVMIFDQIKH